MHIIILLLFFCLHVCICAHMYLFPVTAVCVGVYVLDISHMFAGTHKVQKRALNPQHLVVNYPVVGAQNQTQFP